MTNNQYATSMHANQKLNGEYVCLNIKFYKIPH